MTDTNAERWASPTLRPMSFPEFVVTVAAIMALNPLAMDMMLPALPDIGAAFSITNANHLQFVLSTFLVYRMGRVFVPARPWLPAIVYLSAPLPMLAANYISTDGTLAALEALAVACWVHARFGGGNARWVDAMWLAFGLAFLTKGPPALLPLLAVLACTWLAPSPRPMSRLQLFGGVLLTFCRDR